MAGMARVLLALCVVLATGVVIKQKVGPVVKVIELIKDLQTRLEGEAKDEAAQYDKYACFCKEQVDNCVYEDEGHDKKLAELDATIDKLSADIKSLNKEITDLRATITKIEGTIKTEADQRAKDHASYKAWAKELASAISALDRAIEAMKAAKDDQSDEVKLDLQQVRATAAKIGIVSFLQQDPEVYEYRSNDIIATLQDLHKQFLQNQNEHDKDEFDANAAWQERDADNNRQKDFAEQDKAEKEKISAYKDELKGKAEADRDNVRAEKARNLKFLGELKVECQEKANLWDQRSTMRSRELQTISQALELLGSKVKEQFKANKKLVDIQVKEKVKIPKAHAFVQLRSDRKRSNLLRSSTAKEERAVARKAAAFLSTTAGKLGSKLLAFTAVRMTASEDHFVKVRSIINDLISRLKDDAQSEETQKTMCDKGMSEGVKNRDEAQADVEATSATIETKEADKAQAVGAVAEMAQQIAMLQKALVEETELRAEEKVENTKTVDTARVGEKGVEEALELLQDFYDEAEYAMLQKTQKQPRIDSAAPKDDKIYRDVAPDIFQEHYRGAQKASKGILGLLNTILSDFERTVDVTSDNEKDAQSKFDMDKASMEEMIKMFEDEKKRQEGEVTRLEKELIGHQDDLKNYQESKQDALDALSALESSCVDGEETYDERVAAREKEIEALKEAHDILENWKGL